MTEQAPEPQGNMGRPVPRVDGRLKVTGEARYPADVPIGNLAHAVLVTSSIACGQVDKVHDEAARRVPGVLDVLTHDGVDGRLRKPDFGVASATSIGPLHERRIWHDGQIVALVVAETPEVAEEAARLVTVEYADLPPSAGFDTEGSETVDASEAAGREDPEVGDFDAAFVDAPVRIDATY